MRLYLVITQRVTWAGMGVNLPILADCLALADWNTLLQRRNKDDPNPSVVWNIMGGAFDCHLSDRALAMAGYVHPFQAGTVMVSVTYSQQLARAGTYRQ